MTLSELMTELREDFLEDSIKPYMWSDSKLLRYLNEAIKEACMRSPLLKSTQIIAVAAGTSSYTLADETLDIDEVRLALQPAPLIHSTHDQLTNQYGTTWMEATGTPSDYVRKQLTLTLHPEPIVADTMTVLSFYVPEKMASSGQTPEIPEQYHRPLLYWCAYKAFLSPDVDLGNVDRAMSFYALFEKYFGPIRSAKYDVIQISSPKYNTVAPLRMA